VPVFLPNGEEIGLLLDLAPVATPDDDPHVDPVPPP
jgi:hypothetical protein